MRIICNHQEGLIFQGLTYYNALIYTIIFLRFDYIRRIKDGHIERARKKAYAVQVELSSKINAPQSYPIGWLLLK